MSDVMGCGLSKTNDTIVLRLPRRKRKLWIVPGQPRDLNGDDLDAFIHNIDLILQWDDVDSDVSSEDRRHWLDELLQQCRYLREHPDYLQHELLGNDAPFVVPPWFDAREARAYLKHGSSRLVTGGAQQYWPVSGLGPSWTQEDANQLFMKMVARRPGGFNTSVLYAPNISML